MPRGAAASVSATHAMHLAHAVTRVVRHALRWSPSSASWPGWHARASVSRAACGTRTRRRARRSHRHGATVTRCIARIAIQSHLRRFDMTSINERMCVGAIHGMHEAAGAVARNRSLLQRAVAGARPAHGSSRARAPILSHRLSTDAGPQTNDRFKRRAGYLGTAVSSNTRSGRRWWPGQYVLPYIRWTGPNRASLMGGGASKPFSITT